MRDCFGAKAPRNDGYGTGYSLIPIPYSLTPIPYLIQLYTPSNVPIAAQAVTAYTHTGRELLSFAAGERPLDLAVR